MQFSQNKFIIPTFLWLFFKYALRRADKYFIMNEGNMVKKHCVRSMESMNHNTEKHLPKYAVIEQDLAEK